MEINPKYGIGKLLFGMKQKDVEAIYGKPNKQFRDEDKVIGKRAVDVKEALLAHHFKTWENEDFDLAENHFNEDNWLILQTEFGVIAKIEIGAIINNADEFDWKFKSV